MKRKRPRLDLVPPSGVFVQTPDFKTYYIKGKRKLPISEIHFTSWNADRIPVSYLAVKDFEDGPRLGFRDGSLVKDFADGIMYLISDTKRRRIEDESSFLALGGKKLLTTVPSEYIRVHKEGEPIGNNSPTE